MNKQYLLFGVILSILIIYIWIVNVNKSVSIKKEIELNEKIDNEIDKQKNIENTKEEFESSSENPFELEKILLDQLHYPWSAKTPSFHTKYSVDPEEKGVLDRTSYKGRSTHALNLAQKPEGAKIEKKYQWRGPHQTL